MSTCVNNLDSINFNYSNSTYNYNKSSCYFYCYLFFTKYYILLRRGFGLGQMATRFRWRGISPHPSRVRVGTNSGRGYPQCLQVCSIRLSWLTLSASVWEQWWTCGNPLGKEGSSFGNSVFCSTVTCVYSNCSFATSIRSYNTGTNSGDIFNNKNALFKNKKYEKFI